MKQAISYSALLMAVFLLTNCNVNRNASDKPGEKSTASGIKEGDKPQQATITGRYWKLVEVAGAPVRSGNNKEPHIQLSAQDNRVSGTGGCNSLSGGYELKGPDRIRFSQIAATQMACVNMETESALYKALETTDSYILKGDTLILHRARMAPLARFVAVDKGQENTALNGTWELNYISGIRIAFDGLYPKKKPTLTFSLPQNRVTGNGSCNQYSCEVKVDGSNISFGDAASTLMACEGNGEHTFFQTLKSVNKYSLSEDNTTLNLIMGDIAVMRFTRK